MESRYHVPVMLKECIEGLNIKPDGLYVDGTAGGGGHSEAIVSRLGEGGRLIACDRDSEAIEAVRERLAPYEGKFETVHANFVNLKEFLGGRRPDGILLDLGVSSHQLDAAERGFSYIADAPLDMRMNREDAKSAYEVVNRYSEEALAEILYRYGEEKFARRIAAAIAEARKEKPIETTGELAKLIEGAIPPRFREKGSHPAKRSFQAIRIEVNGELDVIEPTVKAAAEVLKTGGRLAVITFHSLEDRAVKQTIAELAKGCTCPPEFPVCVCGKKPTLKNLTKKPILPSEKEREENPRSHSAKLRLAEKIGGKETP